MFDNKRSQTLILVYWTIPGFASAPQFTSTAKIALEPRMYFVFQSPGFPGWEQTWSTLDCDRVDITCLYNHYQVDTHILKPRIREGSSREGNILHDGNEMGNKNWSIMIITEHHWLKKCSDRSTVFLGCSKRFSDFLDDSRISNESLST